MNPSWKTTLCGLLAAFCLGLSQISEFPPLAVKILALLGGLFPAVGLLFARDNKVSSEQAGASKTGFKPPLPTMALLLAPALLFVSCRQIAPDGPYHGDQLAYEADKTIVTGYEVLHDFVLWEQANLAALAGNPGVKQAADYVRANAKRWLNTAIVARDAYTALPSPETRSSLTRSLAVLRAAMVEAVKYLSQPQTPTPSP